jgi:hypothetical protein
MAKVLVLGTHVRTRLYKRPVIPLRLLAQFMHHHLAPSTLDPRLSLFIPFRPHVTMIRCLAFDFWILGKSIVQERIDKRVDLGDELGSRGRGQEEREIGECLV